MGDIKVTAEAAARAAARDYSLNQNAADAQQKANLIVANSLPVQQINNGPMTYNQTSDCILSIVTVGGSQYATATVCYHYPVLVPTLPTLLSHTAQAFGSSLPVYGTAAFLVGT